jgi:hypothetical protein
VAPPPAPVAIAPVDPLTFTDDAPAFSAETLAVLATPVDPELVEVRQPNDLVYVPWVHYHSILLRAFGPGGYKLVPRSVPRTEGNVVTWVKALFVRPPGSTKFQFIKEAKGECNAHGGMTAGNAAEGAHSDALVKCCKELGIFMELFDPRWRRAWEDKYKAKHLAAKAKKSWPAARGGAASPAAGAVALPVSTTQEPTPSAGAATAPAASGDTGEAATAEAKQAVADRLHELAWKWSFLREWVASHFGLQVDKPARMLEALTQVQADAMLALLMAFNKPAVYQRLIGELRERGVVLR